MEVRKYLNRRFWGLKIQGQNFAHVGVEMSGRIISRSSSPWGTSPTRLSPFQQLRCRGRRVTALVRRTRFGYVNVHWLAAVSRPDTCAPPATLAARADALQGGDISRINDLTGTFAERQTAAMLDLSIAPSFHPREFVRGDAEGEMRRRGGKVHRGARAPAGWPDAAGGDQTKGGRCRSGRATGLRVPCCDRGRCRSDGRQSSPGKW